MCEKGMQCWSVWAYVISLIVTTLVPSIFLWISRFHLSLRWSKIPLCMCSTSSSSVDGHVCWFHFLAIVKRAAVNMTVQASPRIESLGYTSQECIAGTRGNCMCSHLRTLHTHVHSGYTNLPFHQPWITPFFSFIHTRMCCHLSSHSCSDCGEVAE